MSQATPEHTRGRVLVLETNAPLRSAIITLLAAERFDVQRVDSLEAARLVGMAADRTVALVAWQSMDGLLAEQHRLELAELTRRLPLIVMVPRRWARLLEETDLPSAVSAMIAKPFDADELINTVELALTQSIEADAFTN